MKDRLGSVEHMQVLESIIPLVPLKKLKQERRNLPLRQRIEHLACMLGVEHREQHKGSSSGPMRALD